MRACPTGNGKGACALCFARVSNIRPTGLPREEHRGGSINALRPGGERLMLTKPEMSAHLAAEWRSCEEVTR